MTCPSLSLPLPRLALHTQMESSIGSHALTCRLRKVILVDYVPTVRFGKHSAPHISARDRRYVWGCARKHASKHPGTLGSLRTKRPSQICFGFPNAPRQQPDRCRPRYTQTCMGRNRWLAWLPWPSTSKGTIPVGPVISASLPEVDVEYANLEGIARFCHSYPVGDFA